MDPPQHAAVKTAIQALDRLDPVLPLSPGRAERHRFEYFRHGTLFLYAALDVKTGEVHGKTASRHISAQDADGTRFPRDVRLPGDQRGDAAAKQRMIVNRKNTHLAGLSCHLLIFN
jgi:hypothetical protein